MAFQIPEPAGDLPENRFEFTDIKGKAFSLPKMDYLPFAATEYLEGVTTGTIPDPGFSAFIRKFMTTAEPKVAPAVKALTRDQLVALRNAWYEASKVTVGESSASEDS